ncbi:MAG TPA: FKBP-type peptidyl-prolyl cis-trans isomerase [Myxococcales bacterium]|nr:FKBP-type peptidyl-prolyl cis-trans isomerase [Myxococcales bacterium]
MIRVGVTAALISLSLAAHAQALKTEDDKTLYAIGYLTGQRMSVLQLNPSEEKIVEQGFRDAATGTKAKVDVEQRQDAINKLAQARSAAGAEKEKTSAKAYTAKAAQEKGAQQLPSGLVFKVTRPGNGPSPKETDRVKVNYEGRLTNGTVFDSSYKRGQPAEFPLNQVIKCWTEGVQKMHVGEEAQLVCPSDIAYGDSGRPPQIPGGATLVFKVELLGINGQP